MTPYAVWYATQHGPRAHALDGAPLATVLPPRVRPERTVARGLARVGAAVGALPARAVALSRRAPRVSHSGC